MGNEYCKQKQHRKRLILVNKAKILSETLEAREGNSVFIEQPNEINRPFQEEYREPLNADSTQLCMLVPIQDLEDRLLVKRTDVELPSCRFV